MPLQCTVVTAKPRINCNTLLGCRLVLEVVQLSYGPLLDQSSTCLVINVLLFCDVRNVQCLPIRTDLQYLKVLFRTLKTYQKVVALRLLPRS